MGLAETMRIPWRSQQDRVVAIAAGHGLKATTCTSLASADVARGSAAMCFGRALGIRLKAHNGSCYGSVCACVTFTCTLHVQLHLCLHLPQLTVDLTVVEAPATCGTAATQQGFHFLGLHDGRIPS